MGDDRGDIDIDHIEDTVDTIDLEMLDEKNTEQTHAVKPSEKTHTFTLAQEK